MNEKVDIEGVKPYGGAAAGWGALLATARAVKHQLDVPKEVHGLARMNQPTGFDCPGCACLIIYHHGLPQAF